MTTRSHSRNTQTIIAALFAALALATTTHAAVNDRDWPSVVPTPAIDVPMQDTAITRGPDGTYYLTGTLGAPAKNPSDQSAPPDFENGRQIKLWKSPDLKTWTEICVAYDLEKPAGDYTKHIWMTRQAHKDPARADSPVCQGFKAPELHFVKGNWYICFSMNDQGTGLLESTSGKPEGPYEPHAQITLRNGDPSLFWDAKDEFGGDDSVYFLFGGGWIAKLNDDLTALAERPRLLQPQPQTQADWTKATRWDFPLQVGDHGVFLFKNRGRYYLTAAERTNRMNASCDDTFVAMATSVYGPYDQRTLMVPHGGGITVFRGPRSSAVPKYSYPQQAFFANSVSKNAKPKEEVEKAKGDDTLYATFFGNDERAAFRDSPAFLPLEWTGPNNFSSGFYDYESHPRKPLCVITERGPWQWMKPLLPDERIRDVKVGVAPDGYYFSGSTISHPGKMSIWRSKDLAKWEMLPPAWAYEQIEWLPEKKPYAKGVYPEDPNGLDIDWKHIFWHTYVTWWKDTFYITFVIFDNDNPAGRGTTALKSTSGKIEGPYISLGKVGGQMGLDPGPVWEDPMFNYKGQLYSSDWKGWRDHVAIADVNVPGWKWDWKRVDHGIYDIMQREDCTLVDAIEDVPIYCFRSSGPLDGGERERVMTYDVNYIAMETPWGPVRKGAKPRCVPHVAVSNLFKDHQGRWWASMFGTENTSPWVEKFGLVALKVEKLPDGDIFIDVENNPDDYQKKIMGGGQIAEVKTVLETIEPAK